MTGPTPTSPVGPPPAIDVVSVEAAQALIDEVHASIRALEHELEVVRQKATEAERRSTMAPTVDEAVLEELRRMADNFRADAKADAARVVDDARRRADAAVEDARREQQTDPMSAD